MRSLIHRFRVYTRARRITSIRQTRLAKEFFRRLANGNAIRLDYLYSIDELEEKAYLMAWAEIERERRSAVGARSRQEWKRLERIAMENEEAAR